MIKSRFQKPLTAEQKEHVAQCLSKLDEARVYCQSAADDLAGIEPLASERSKLVASAEGLRWERQLVLKRLDEMAKRSLTPDGGVVT
jgi:hypothetical protein